jgi:hypothetical protein
MYIWNILQWINRRVLKTYSLIEDCARCRDCGTNVHNFNVPDELWKEVVGKEIVLCYDCFCDKADRKFKMKWRYELKERWTNQNGEIYGG